MFQFAARWFERKKKKIFACLKTVYTKGSVKSRYYGFCCCCICGIVRLKHDGTRAETRFLLSPKRTSPFKSAGASVQSTAGSRGVRISVSNAGYTMFRGSVRVLATHSIRQFPLHSPSRASPWAIRFQRHSNWECTIP